MLNSLVHFNALDTYVSLPEEYVTQKSKVIHVPISMYICSQTINIIIQSRNTKHNQKTQFGSWPRRGSRHSVGDAPSIPSKAQHGLAPEAQVEPRGVPCGVCHVGLPVGLSVDVRLCDAGSSSRCSSREKEESEAK